MEETKEKQSSLFSISNQDQCEVSKPELAGNIQKENENILEQDQKCDLTTVEDLYASLEKHHRPFEKDSNLLFPTPQSGDQYSLNEKENKIISIKSRDLSIRAEGNIYDDVKDKEHIENELNDLVTDSSNRPKNEEIQQLENDFLICQALDAEECPGSKKNFEIKKASTEEKINVKESGQEWTGTSYLPDSTKRSISIDAFNTKSIALLTEFSSKQAQNVNAVDTVKNEGNILDSEKLKNAKHIVEGCEHQPNTLGTRKVEDFSETIVENQKNSKHFFLDENGLSDSNVTSFLCGYPDMEQEKNSKIDKGIEEYSLHDREQFGDAAALVYSSRTKEVEKCSQDDDPSYLDFQESNKAVNQLKEYETIESNKAKEIIEWPQKDIDDVKNSIIIDGAFEREQNNGDTVIDSFEIKETMKCLAKREELLLEVPETMEAVQCSQKDKDNCVDILATTKMPDAVENSDVGFIAHASDSQEPVRCLQNDNEFVVDPIDVKEPIECLVNDDEFVEDSIESKEEVKFSQKDDKLVVDTLDIKEPSLIDGDPIDTKESIDCLQKDIGFLEDPIEPKEEADSLKKDDEFAVDTLDTKEPSLIDVFPIDTKEPTAYLQKDADFVEDPIESREEIECLQKEDELVENPIESKEEIECLQKEDELVENPIESKEEVECLQKEDELVENPILSKEEVECLKKDDEFAVDTLDTKEPSLIDVDPIGTKEPTAYLQKDADFVENPIESKEEVDCSQKDDEFAVDTLDTKEQVESLQNDEKKFGVDPIDTKEINDCLQNDDEFAIDALHSKEHFQCSQNDAEFIVDPINCKELVDSLQNDHDIVLDTLDTKELVESLQKDEQEFGVDPINIKEQIDCLQKGNEFAVDELDSKGPVQCTQNDDKFSVDPIDTEDLIDSLQKENEFFVDTIDIKKTDDSLQRGDEFDMDSLKTNEATDFSRQNEEFSPDQFSTKENTGFLQKKENKAENECLQKNDDSLDLFKTEESFNQLQNNEACASNVFAIKETCICSETKQDLNTYLLEVKGSNQSQLEDEDNFANSFKPKLTFESLQKDESLVENLLVPKKSVEFSQEDENFSEGPVKTKIIAENACNNEELATDSHTREETMLEPFEIKESVDGVPKTLEHGEDTLETKENTDCAQKDKDCLPGSQELNETVGYLQKDENIVIAPFEIKGKSECLQKTENLTTAHTEVTDIVEYPQICDDMDKESLQTKDNIEFPKKFEDIDSDLLQIKKGVDCLKRCEDIITIPNKNEDIAESTQAKQIPENESDKSVYSELFESNESVKYTEEIKDPNTYSIENKESSECSHKYEENEEAGKEDYVYSDQDEAQSTNIGEQKNNLTCVPATDYKNDSVLLSLNSSRENSSSLNEVAKNIFQDMVAQNKDKIEEMFLGNSMISSDENSLIKEDSSELMECEEYLNLIGNIQDFDTDSLNDLSQSLRRNISANIESDNTKETSLSQTTVQDKLISQTKPDNIDNAKNWNTEKEQDGVNSENFNLEQQNISYSSGLTKLTQKIKNMAKDISNIKGIVESFTYDFKETNGSSVDSEKFETVDYDGKKIDKIIEEEKLSDDTCSSSQMHLGLNYGNNETYSLKKRLKLPDNSDELDGDHEDNSAHNSSKEHALNYNVLNDMDTNENVDIILKSEVLEIRPQEEANEHKIWHNNDGRSTIASTTINPLKNHTFILSARNSKCNVRTKDNNSESSDEKKVHTSSKQNFTEIQQGSEQKDKDARKLEEIKVSTFKSALSGNENRKFLANTFFQKFTPKTYNLKTGSKCSSRITKRKSSNIRRLQHKFQQDQADSGEFENVMSKVQRFNNDKQNEEATTPRKAQSPSPGPRRARSPEKLDRPYRHWQGVSNLVSDTRFIIASKKSKEHIESLKTSIDSKLSIASKKQKNVEEAHGTCSSENIPRSSSSFSSNISEWVDNIDMGKFNGIFSDNCYGSDSYMSSDSNCEVIEAQDTSIQTIKPQLSLQNMSNKFVFSNTEKKEYDKSLPCFAHKGKFKTDRQLKISPLESNTQDKVRLSVDLDDDEPRQSSLVNAENVNQENSLKSGKTQEICHGKKPQLSYSEEFIYARPNLDKCYKKESCHVNIPVKIAKSMFLNETEDKNRFDANSRKCAVEKKISERNKTDLVVSPLRTKATLGKNTTNKIRKKSEIANKAPVLLTSKRAGIRRASSKHLKQSDNGHNGMAETAVPSGSISNSPNKSSIVLKEKWNNSLRHRQTSEISQKRHSSFPRAAQQDKKICPSNKSKIRSKTVSKYQNLFNYSKIEQIKISKNFKPFSGARTSDPNKPDKEDATFSELLQFAEKQIDTIPKHRTTKFYHQKVPIPDFDIQNTFNLPHTPNYTEENREILKDNELSESICDETGHNSSGQKGFDECRKKFEIISKESSTHFPKNQISRTNRRSRSRHVSRNYRAMSRNARTISRNLQMNRLSRPNSPFIIRKGPSTGPPTTVVKLSGKNFERLAEESESQTPNVSDDTRNHNRYITVMALKDFAGGLPGQLCFKQGQIIKMKRNLQEVTNGMGYGYYRTRRWKKKKRGLFPLAYVTEQFAKKITDV